MKKLVVLMSVSLMALTSYSFSVAMQDECGLQTESETVCPEADQLAQEIAQLTLERKERDGKLFKELAKLAESYNFNEKNLAASQSQRLMRSTLLTQIQEVSGEEFSTERLHEYGAARSQRLADEIELDRQKSFYSDVKKSVLEELANGDVQLAGNSINRADLQRQQLERDKLWANQYRAENPRYKKGSQRPTRSLSEIKKDKQLSNEIKSGKTLKRLKADEIQVKTGFDIGVSDGFIRPQEAIKEKSSLAYHNAIKMRYVPLLAGSYGLEFAAVTAIDKSFKFSEWQAQLVQEYFKGPEAIEAGKIHAFKTGDILALIAYADYLDRYYKSGYAFTSAEWNELLKTMLILYVRVAQDCHTVAAVDEFISEIMTGKFPIDARFSAWQASMNKKLFAAEDLTYAQKAQEGIMAHLVKVWSSRMIQACKNDMLVPFEETFDLVSFMVNEMINPANMPTPAVVCCLNGKNVSKPSQELEEVFRMFDFSNSEVRKEGLDIALSQIGRCQSWEEFMATILKIELPAAK